MSLPFKSMLVMLTVLASLAWGQSTANQPHIGYLYPAGGQAGTVLQITVGGQSLRGAHDVYVSGEGVQATVVEYFRPPRNLQKEQRDAIREALKAMRDRRLAERPAPRGRRSSSSARRAGRRPRQAQTAEETEIDLSKLPNHPLLRDFEAKTLRELAHVKEMLFFPRAKRQTNRQLAEMVLLEVTIDPNAPSGDREVRLATAAGLTNPVVFQVANLPEIRELEPNNQQAYPPLPEIPDRTVLLGDKPLALPITLNGQIMPGDVDRFRFRARQGQRLVLEVQARHLIPYLADAVPGWFQATLALYDARGKEVAYADDYRHHPDPTLFYEIPADGEYELEIRDSLYRGREDFVYRVAVSDRPFITQMFPLGVTAGAETQATVSGWNLPETPLTLSAPPDGAAISQTAYAEARRRSNSVPYAVDALPDCLEVETNDTLEAAQSIDLPMIVNGRIDDEKDVDVFRIRGRAGSRLVAEVMSRRLNSPLDSLLRITDASGNVLAWNDDYVQQKEHLYQDLLGLSTHHADSYLMAELPHNGTFYVRLSDALRHGGPQYGYRLRLSSPGPDFALRVTPSSLQMRAGGIVPLCIHVLRRDGFEGAVDLVLKNAPPGFSLAGARVPPESDRVHMTLRAPGKIDRGPVVLELEGQARIAGRTIRHRAVPADDVMQAFLYRHLVPAQNLLISVQKGRSGLPPTNVAADGPIRIPVGGSASVLIKMPTRPILEEIRLELRESPAGLTLDQVAIVPQGLSLQLKMDRGGSFKGLRDNIIVEAFREYIPKDKDGIPLNRKRRYSLGVLPAIPIEIVASSSP